MTASMTSASSSGAPAATVFSCSLRGVLSSSSTPGVASSLGTLLDLIHSLVDSHGIAGFVSASSSSSSSSVTSSSSSSPSSSSSVQDGLLHRRARVEQAHHLAHSPLHRYRRPLCLLQRVYIPSSLMHAEAAAKGNEWRVSLDLCPSSIRSSSRAANSDAWIVSSYSRPILPAKHSCLVQSMKCFSLTVCRSNDTQSPSPSPAQNRDALTAQLDFLGYRFDYEYLQEGWQWTTAFQSDESSSSSSFPVDIRVYTLSLLKNTHDVSSVDLIRGLPWIVEIIAIAKDQNLAQVEDSLTAFARELKSLVNLSPAAPET